MEALLVKRTAILILLVVVFGAALLAQSAGQQANQPPKADVDKKAKRPATTAVKKSAAPAAEKADAMTSATFTGLELRSIGPAVTSGRIIDIAVSPREPRTWFVATVGGVWKTTTSGTSWTPVFDGEGSFSIGCVAIDPEDPAVVWVGTGENNSQRSVSYGDGVYRSEDGGKSWENVGLKDSMHIGKIVIDPRDSKVVYAAAMGNLWAPGGDRGVYKTTDSGKTWKRVLEISENTGVVDLAFDPRNPDLLYAAAYQRRRHVWTLIDGGPESAIYRSMDAGGTWKKTTSGLPTQDMGRIGPPNQTSSTPSWRRRTARAGSFVRPIAARAGRR
jgi:photosystem II stability/assembly factor-like uncharacterized protein